MTRRPAQFKVYTEKDGLRNATILGILQDANGFLWLTTNNGLAKFDPQSGASKSTIKATGCRATNSTPTPISRRKTVRFYVGGVSGFSVFNPRSNLGPNTTLPQVVITDFSIFNLPQTFDASGQTPIRLSFDQNFIAFEFAALDYHAPRQNQYAYKLEGFDARIGCRRAPATMPVTPICPAATIPSGCGLPTVRVSGTKLGQPSG